MNDDRKNDYIRDITLVLVSSRKAVDRISEVICEMSKRFESLSEKREELVADFVVNHPESDAFDKETNDEFTRLTNEIGSAVAMIEMADDALLGCRSVVMEMNRQIENLTEHIKLMV